MSLEFLIRILPEFVTPLWITLSLWLLSLVIGMILAVPIAIAASAGGLVARGLAVIFVTCIRGTPLLVQFYIIYYGIGTLLAQIRWIRKSAIWPILQEAYWYALLALVISCAAYSAEILRGGIRAVPKGEVEAARSLGLHRIHVWRLIVLPRAVRIALPALGGEAVILLKSTVLASTITVMDLLGMANYIRAQTFRDYEPLLVVTVVYVVLTFLLSRLIARIERQKAPA
ncbi:MAG: ABC transporter permease subunit [Rhodobacteraceae bacterium]|jgi:polar amino acid transport system permease protein|nr:ABC transporter permease subunit [Paracoccaceae bacterium]